MEMNEAIRLKSANLFVGLQFNLNSGLEGLLKLATDICETPVAFLTILDKDTQWFKVARGMQVMQMPRQDSFCTYTIMEDKVMVVPDPTQDERFKHIPLVAHEPHIRFYAGAPLTTEDGQNVGTLCVFDAVSKQLSESKQESLGLLAAQATHLMELDVCLGLLKEHKRRIDLQNEALTDIAFTQSHEFRGPLSTIMGLMNIIKDENYESPKEYLLHMETVVAKLDEKVKLVVKSTQRAVEVRDGV